jgi:hypothetical protein
MMMWDKLKLVAAGAVVAIGLSAQAVSQQAHEARALAARSPQTAAQPAEKPNELPAGDRRWVRSLPSGAIIEVLGVSTFPSGRDTWWRPDGTPLDRPPSDPVEPRIAGEDAVRMLVVARFARIPDGADYEWSITESQGAAWSPAVRDGKPIPDVYLMTALMPPDAGTCTVRFKVAAGPWNTIVKWGTNPGSVGNRDGPNCIFSSPIASKNGTTLSVTHDIKDKPVRLVALDSDGNEVPAKIQSGSGVKDFQQIVAEFDVPPEQIQGFRLQTRPYEEVEIPRISLKRK